MHPQLHSRAMLKALIIALVFIFPAIAEDSFMLPHRQWEKGELEGANVGFGLARIIYGRYQEALEDFEAAEKLSPDPELRFMLLFGKIITYDCLNMRPECERSIGALMLLMAQYESQENCIEDFDSKFMDELFKSLAQKAPSKDVRKFLLEIFE